MENVEFNSSDIQNTKSQLHNKGLFKKTDEDSKPKFDLSKKSLMIIALCEAVVIIVLAVFLIIMLSNQSHCEDYAVVDYSEEEDDGSPIDNDELDGFYDSLLIEDKKEDALDKIDKFYNTQMSALKEDDYENRAYLVLKKSEAVSIFDIEKAIQILEDAKKEYPSLSPNTKIEFCEAEQLYAKDLGNMDLWQRYQNECDALYSETGESYGI